MSYNLIKINIDAYFCIFAIKFEILGQLAISIEIEQKFTKFVIISRTATQKATFTRERIKFCV